MSLIVLNFKYGFIIHNFMPNDSEQIKNFALIGIALNTAAVEAVDSNQAKAKKLLNEVIDRTKVMISQLSP